ncbi:MAG: hypothetical protein KAH31_07185 [Candidatus Sabulitectum sp.]|nr:hypothetical protein [Candidatus Sabulitectum sp.]
MLEANINIISGSGSDSSDPNKQFAIKHLSGMLPICPSCKRIRDDDGYWQQVDSYISSHSAAQFKHSFCADCMEKLYPDLSDADEMFNGEQG